MPSKGYRFKINYSICDMWWPTLQRDRLAFYKSFEKLFKIWKKAHTARALRIYAPLIFLQNYLYLAPPCSFNMIETHEVVPASSEVATASASAMLHSRAWCTACRSTRNWRYRGAEKLHRSKAGSGAASAANAPCLCGPRLSFSN